MWGSEGRTIKKREKKKKKPDKIWSQLNVFASPIQGLFWSTHYIVKVFHVQVGEGALQPGIISLASQEEK